MISVDAGQYKLYIQVQAGMSFCVGCHENKKFHAFHWIICTWDYGETYWDQQGAAISNNSRSSGVRRNKAGVWTLTQTNTSGKRDGGLHKVNEAHITHPDILMWRIKATWLQIQFSLRVLLLYFKKSLVCMMQKNKSCIPDPYTLILNRLKCKYVGEGGQSVWIHSVYRC